MVNVKISAFDFVVVVAHDEIHEVSKNDLYQYFVTKVQEHIHMEQDVLVIDLSLNIQLYQKSFFRHLAEIYCNFEVRAVLKTIRSSR